jgi:hypothetical protein
VQVIGANITPAPTDGETYAGNKELKDDSGLFLQLHTEENADFADEKISTNVQFSGIAKYYNAQSGDTSGAVKQIWMRNLSDAVSTDGPIYSFFPEDFNTTLEKNSYAMDNLDIKSGNWTFDGVTLVTITDSRPINPDGTKGVQFNQKNATPLYLQMNFDVPNGASKVSLLYGSYGSDPACIWRLEYSTNGGVDWIQTGEDVITGNKTAQTATFIMDITGPVRFRINKIGLGASNNGRLNVDDITIYKN